MFTGIVEEMGSVIAIQRRGGGARLVVQAPTAAKELAVGDSIAVNGACVTVTETDGSRFACDLVPETVARTNLGILQVNEGVNLERPVRAADRLGGHIVQGHVDAVGVIRSRRKAGAQEMLEVTVPFELTKYLAPQGSVTIDGVSLTVVGVDRDRFRVALIPHTVEATTLGRKGQQAAVNVEVDVISKYVERHMAVRAARPAVSVLFEDVPKERAESSDEPASPKPAPRRVPPPASTPKAAQHKKPVAKKAAPKAAKKTVKVAKPARRATAKRH